MDTTKMTGRLDCPAAYKRQRLLTAINTRFH